MIPIKNLYFLLCYSWSRLDEGSLVNISSDQITTPPDLLAKVLINGVNRLLKDGIDRGYITELQESSSLKGKIDFGVSLSKLLFQQAKAATHVDDLSVDILHNQILKTTIFNLHKNAKLNIELRSELKKILTSLRDVSVIRLNASIFKRVQIYQNNSFYSFLMNVCELIYVNLLPDEKTGDWKFKDFTRDERKMHKVFQDFAFNFYRINQNKYAVKSEKLNYQALALDDSLDLLPNMYTDVTLESDEEKIILDTKYYQEAFQSNWGKKSFRSEHLYQLNTYLDYSDSPHKKPSGILLYPATNEEFTHEFDTPRHHFKIAAVDLRKDPKDIEKRMLDILI